MNIIKERRIAEGLTQNKLALMMGVDRTTVAKWETGKAFPKSKTLLLLASVLNMSVVELLSQKVEEEAS